MTLQQPNYNDNNDRLLYAQMEQEAVKGRSICWTQEQKDFYNYMCITEEQRSEWGCGK